MTQPPRADFLACDEHRGCVVLLAHGHDARHLDSGQQTLMLLALVCSTNAGEPAFSVGGEPFTLAEERTLRETLTQLILADARRELGQPPPAWLN